MRPHPKGGHYRTDDPGEPSSGLPRVSVADDEIELLASLVVGLHVLEIGTGLGVSTRALASTADTVVTVDIDEWVHANIWPNLPKNVTRCTSIAAAGDGFTAVFIDGDHSRHAVRADVQRATELSAPGGLLIAHDAKHVGRWLGDGWVHYDTTYGVATLRLP